MSRLLLDSNRHWSRNGWRSSGLDPSNASGDLMRVVGVGDGVGGVDVGGARPRSVSTCTSCCNISLESVGLVLDTGADPGVEWLCSSVGCSSSVWLLTSCGRYWNGLGERVGESRMCT